MKSRIARLAANVGLLAGSLGLFLLLGEGVFSFLGYDFAKEEAAWRRYPPYYRAPMVPIGEVYYRREGFQQWTGQVLRTAFDEAHNHFAPNPYLNEAVATVRYDRYGFRNEPRPTDWDIVITGDSFAELGYLRYDQLFTTIVGKMLNTRVLNLGVARSGPLSQLTYLKEYGVSASTRQAMIIFFEGNDLEDLGHEADALDGFERTGRREYRVFKRNTSMARAAVRFVRSMGDRKAQPPFVNAFFRSATGPIPTTLVYAPPSEADMSAETMHRLEYFFSEYAAFGKARHVSLWLGYMPCKERVTYGLLDWFPEASPRLSRWVPSDLPNVISKLSKRFGIRFVDLTPAMVEETRTSHELVYNSIWDTHLTARGATVVARELARQLSPEWVGQGEAQDSVHGVGVDRARDARRSQSPPLPRDRRHTPTNRPHGSPARGENP